MACFLAGTETLLAKANTVGSTTASKLNYRGDAREPRISMGHGRDTGKFSRCKPLILLALPRGLNPCFRRERGDDTSLPLS